MPILVVPQFPPVLDISEANYRLNGDLRAAHPVRGTFQWQDYGQAALWALARGGTLVMQGPTFDSIAAAGTATWRWWVWPRAHIVARLWCVSLAMPGAADAIAHRATGDIEIPDATTIGRWALTPAGFGKVQTFRYLQRIASPSATPGEVTMTLDVDAGAGADVFMVGVCCYEISRATLSQYGAGPDPAPDTGTLQTGSLITEQGTTGKSLDGVLAAASDPDLLQTETRRSALFTDFRPGGMNTISTTYTNIFLRNPSVMGRARYASETVRTVQVAVYGKGPAGSNVRITASTGDVATVSLPTPLPGWDTAALDIETEDPSRWATDGGIRGGTRERLTIEGQRVGGSAGDCVVYGVCVGEPD